MYRTKDSLCWHCSRALDSSCSWSNSFTPVDGWVAERSVTKGHYGAETFKVIECPIFADYEINTMTDEGTERLADAVIAAAGREYWEGCVEAKHLFSDLSRIKTCCSLYGGDHKGIYGKTKAKVDRYCDLGIRLKALENFFSSERAKMFYQGDPVYIIEKIQNHVGFSSEDM